MPVGCFPRDRANCTAPGYEFESSSREREQWATPALLIRHFWRGWQTRKRDCPLSQGRTNREGGRSLFLCAGDDSVGAVREPPLSEKRALHEAPLLFLCPGNQPPLPPLSGGYKEKAPLIRGVGGFRQGGPRKSTPPYPPLSGGHEKATPRRESGFP